MPTKSSVFTAGMLNELESAVRTVTGPWKFAIIVDRAIRLTRVVRVARGREFTGHIPDQGGGRPAFFERGNIVDRLDGGTRLACGAVCHVDLAGDGFVVEIRRANHGKDLACGRLDGNQRAVVRVLVGEQGYLFGDQPLGFILKRWVERGVDDEAGAIDRLRIVLSFPVLNGRS